MGIGFGIGLVLALFWMLPTRCWAAAPLVSVVVEWEPNEEAFVYDYVVSYGTRSGFLPFSLKSDGLTRVSIPRLKAGRTYYFAVRAVAWPRLFSDFSDEVSSTLPAGCEAEDIPLTVSPLVQGVRVSFSGVPRTKYQLLASPDLKAWTPVWTSPIAPDTGPTVFEFVDETVLGAPFYRAQVIGRYDEAKHPPAVSRNGDQGYTLHFEGVFGSVYELQSTEDNTTWNPFWSGSADATGDMKVDDPRPDPGETRHYRLLVSADPLGPYWDPCTAATNEPPTLTEIPRQEVHLDDPATAIPFRVDDGDTPLSALQVEVTSSNPSLLPPGRVQIYGEDNDRWLVLDAARGAFGLSEVTVRVSDGDNEAVSSFEFEVLPYAVHSLRPAIVVHGEGSIRPNLGHELVSGRRYTITAAPGPGQAFVGWGGALSGSSRTMTFVMREEFLIEAYFAPTPFPAIQGTYQGLVGPADGPVPGSAGSVTVTVTGTGGYSGSYTVGRRKQGFSGVLTFDRKATNTIVRAGTNTLSVELAFGTDASEPLQGYIRGAAPEAQMLAYRSAGYPPAAQGSYTLILPAALDDNLGPEGAGFGALKIDKLGRVSLTGVLGDGTKVSSKVALGPDGFWPVSIPLQAGQALIQGWLSLNATNSSSNILSGNLTWLAPSDSRTKRLLYPDGFTNVVEVLAAPYVRPARAGRILPLTQTALTFQGGDLAASFTNSVSLGEGSRVENLGDNPLTLVFNLGNGLFNGTVTDPVSQHSFRYSGAVLQDRAEGWGQLLGTNRSARVSLGF